MTLILWFFCGPWRVIAHYFRSHAASPCLRVLRSLATEAGELMVTPCHIEKSDIETCHCHVSSPTVFKILGLALSVVNGEHCHRLKTPGIAKAPTAGGLTHGTLLFFPRLNWIPPPPPPRLFINRIFAIYPFSPEGVHGADTCHCSRLAQTTKSDKQILGIHTTGDKLQLKVVLISAVSSSSTRFKLGTRLTSTSGESRSNLGSIFHTFSQ